jgi:putative hydrolase of the HAD superfamily
MLRTLRASGHTLALVADGPRATFENILKPHRLWRLFDAFAVSGDVGVSKPDARMFETALQHLEVSPDEYHNVVMVGNNLARDVRGAHALGITTIWLNWSPRRAKEPKDELEVPDYVAATPRDVVRIVRRLEAEAGG